MTKRRSKTIKFEIPGWRKGQTIFNFLEWLRVEKNLTHNQAARLADPFYLPDLEFDFLWEEYQKAKNPITLSIPSKKK